MNIITHPVPTGAGESLEALLERTASELRKGVLPVEIFSNEAVFEAEMERIFARDWIFLGFEAEVPKSGDYMLRHIGKDRSEEHTSELQSLMRISYAVLC